MREESGWVIERGDSDASRPFYWGGACGWTYDNLCAVRFARKEDAESVETTLRWERERKGFQPHNNRIAEHGWFNPKADPDKPASEGTAAMSEEELREILKQHGWEYGRYGTVTIATAIAAMFEVARITREHAEEE